MADTYGEAGVTYGEAGGTYGDLSQDSAPSTWVNFEADFSTASIDDFNTR